MIDLLLSQALQPNWVLVGQTQLGDRIYVNENSFRFTVRNRSRNVHFVSLQMLSRPMSNGTTKIASSHGANCLNNSMASSYVFYDANNQILGRQESPRLDFAPPVQPGSIGQLLHDYACSKLPANNQ